MPPSRRFITKENKEKVARIAQLASYGFNTPRMFLLPNKACIDYMKDFRKWKNKILEDNENQKFNIRTYRYFQEAKEEMSACPHLTDLNSDEVEKEIRRHTKTYVCMIDAETPDNGRYSGNIVMDENELGTRKRFYIEYCKKDIRAMVRDADKHVGGDLVPDDISKLPFELKTVVLEAKKFPFINTILEWTWFCEPAGISKKNLVWWEYRRM